MAKNYDLKIIKVIKDNTSSNNVCIKCRKKSNEYYKLPCSKLICSDCVCEAKLERTDKSVYEYKCDYCKVKHNLNKVRKIDTPPVSVIEKPQTPVVELDEDAKRVKSENIKYLLSKINKYEKLKESQSDSVHSHCETIRYEIELTFESLIAKLNEKRVDTMRKVDSYEVECEKRIGNAQVVTNEFDERIELNKAKLEELEGLANKYDANEMVNIEMNIEKAMVEYQGYTTLNRELNYKTYENLNFDPLIMGQVEEVRKFEIKGFDIDNKKQNLIQKPKIEFEINIEESGANSDNSVINSIHPILENKILIHSNNTINIIDQNGTLINSNNEIITSSSLITTQPLYIYILKDLFLHKYDSEFNLITKVKFTIKAGSTFSSIHCSSTYVYVLVHGFNEYDQRTGKEAHNHYTIYVFRADNLSLVKLLKQMDNITDEYEYIRMHALNAYYVTLLLGQEVQFNFMPIQIFANHTCDKLFIYCLKFNSVFVLNELANFRRLKRIDLDKKKVGHKILSNDIFLDSKELMYFKLEKNSLMIYDDESSKKYRTIENFNFQKIVITNDGNFFTLIKKDGKYIAKVY